MGKASRDKGKRGEREVVAIFRDAGCDRAKRTAPLQAAGLDHGDADVFIGDGFHVEVKYQETLRLPAWLRQLDRDTQGDDHGILAFRRSRERWRAVVPLSLVSVLIQETDRDLKVEAVPTREAYDDRVVVSLHALARALVEAGAIA